MRLNEELGKKRRIYIKLRQGQRGKELLNLV